MLADLYSKEVQLEILNEVAKNQALISVLTYPIPSENGITFF